MIFPLSGGGVSIRLLHEGLESELGVEVLGVDVHLLVSLGFQTLGVGAAFRVLGVRRLPFGHNSSTRHSTPKLPIPRAPDHST